MDVHHVRISMDLAPQAGCYPLHPYPSRSYVILYTDTATAMLERSETSLMWINLDPSCIIFGQPRSYNFGQTETLISSVSLTVLNPLLANDNVYFFLRNPL